MLYFSAFFLSLFVAMALVPICRGLAIKAGAYDVPNERSVHVKPIPKSGGIAMALGMLLPLVVWLASGRFELALLAATVVLVMEGLVDDFKQLGYLPKFVGQIGAALIVIVLGGVKLSYLGVLAPAGFLLPDWLAIPFTLIVIVGVTNAINLADGLDGLAGGIIMISTLCLNLLAYQAGDTQVALIGMALLGAIFAFLTYNTHPANVFMGDAGSQLLGFLSIVLAIRLTQAHPGYSAVLPLLIVGFPILDTLTVMLERIAKGVSPFKADKNHFHHKLMRLGLYHSEAVFAIYVLQSLIIAMAYFYRFYSEWLLLGCYALFCVGVLGGFSWADRSGWRFKRYHFVDVEIKGCLRVLREKHVVIRVAVKLLAVLLPLILLLNAWGAMAIPVYSGLGFGLMALLILAIWRFDGPGLAAVNRLGAYLTIPFLTYFSHAVRPDELVSWHNGLYVLLLLASIVTLQFTRRQKGFKHTTLDYLLLLVAVAVPIWLGGTELMPQLGMFTAKLLILFYSYEVLVGEVRGRQAKYRLVTAITVCTLGLTAVRALLV